MLQALAAGILSMAVARGKRGSLACGGAAAHASLVLALLRWRAARTDLALPALAAAAWGACASLWDVLQVDFSPRVIARRRVVDFFESIKISQSLENIFSLKIIIYNIRPFQAGACIGGAGWRGPWAVVVMARHTGLAVACAARHTLCVRTQLTALAISLVMALASQALLEWKQRRSKFNYPTD